MVIIMIKNLSQTNSAINYKQSLKIPPHLESTVTLP